MPFRRKSLSPIKTDKHEVTWSNLGQNASGGINIELVRPVVSAGKDNAIEVEIGAKVRAIYFEMQFSAETITNTKIVHWKVFAERTGQAKINASNYYQVDRSQVMKRGMEMLPKSVNTIIKRVFLVLIPPVFQRMRENQGIFLNYTVSSAETINACGFTVYKEFY